MSEGVSAMLWIILWRVALLVAVLGGASAWRPRVTAPLGRRNYSSVRPYDHVNVGATAQLQRLVVVSGEPDDITLDAARRLVWGNIANGTVQAFDGRRVTTLARGLSVPEGIVSLPGGGFALIEQGSDRLVRLDARGHISLLHQFVPVAGQEGVDGIGLDAARKQLLVPDSPHGVIMRLSLDGRGARVIARGLGRPVDAAVDRRGDVLVPDEHLNALIVISPAGAVSRIGPFSTPDDVVVDRAGRIWLTTLGDGGLWLIAPGAGPQLLFSGLANPQGLTLDSCGAPVVVQSGNGHIDRVLLNSSASHCAL